MAEDQRDEQTVDRVPEDRGSAMEVEAADLRARLAELEAQMAAGAQDLEAARAAASEASARALAYLRRALLAENAGQVVPELVAGSTVEEMEASVERARAAFASALEVARAQIQQSLVPTGSPPRSASGGLVAEEMSPLQKIVQGLKRT